MTHRTITLIAVLALTACGSGKAYDASGESWDQDSSGFAGVGQGGSQDFGLFKDILDAGEIPGPNTIDDVGFFAEHKMALPDPECGENVCMHAQFGMMGNMISGSDCTVVQIGMNTPIDPETLERPPLNLAVAVDTSGSMGGTSIEYARTGLLAMLDALEPEDRVTIVDFDDEAMVVAESLAADDEALLAAIEGLGANGGTNIYAGLRTAFETAELYADPTLQNRVILLSDGVITEGIEDHGRVVNLADAYARAGFSLTTIGMGDSFDVALMRDLADAGQGAFYFLEDTSAVEEVFTEEVDTFLVPIAQDVTIDVDIDGAWDLRAMYGTRTWEVDGNHGVVAIPTLQIAHRTSASDSEGGRRGGGGAILVEILPENPADPADVGQMTFAYSDPITGERIEQVVAITSEVSPVDAREEGHFAGPSVEKGFVTLNLYVGFEIAAESATAGDYGTALAVLYALDSNVSEWLQANDDEDIEDDLVYVNRFIDNIHATGNSTWTPEEVEEPWPHD